VKNEHAWKSKCETEAEFGHAVAGAKEAAGRGGCGGVQCAPGFPGKGVWCSPQSLALVDHKFLALQLGFGIMGEVRTSCFYLLFI